MTTLVIKQLPYELGSNAGLALVGQYLKRVGLNQQVDTKFPVRSGVANSDILRCYLALLCMGKNDFEAVEGLRGSAFAHRALGLAQVPSSATLRQRLDAQGSRWFELIDQLNERLLSLRVGGERIDFGTLACGYCPLDIDTFAMDNSDSRKQGVGRTYAGVDGYCPLAGYLGEHGYCLQLALRPGQQHSASETVYNLEHLLPLATRLVDAPLLLRLDSGFCSQAIRQSIGDQAAALGRRIDFIIKWNPRQTPVEAWAARQCADAAVIWCQPREGKRCCVWEETVPQEAGASLRRIFRLTERTIDRHGQPLLLPAYDLDGWTTSLPATFTPGQVIDLYARHGTHEQFHSEFKTDMGLERLPSGKFDTNYLVCQLAAMAMNLLRLLGAHTLHGADAPRRHPAQRRRLRTVMQELMYKAARLVRHAGRWMLGLSQNDGAANAFIRHYGELVAT